MNAPFCYVLCRLTCRRERLCEHLTPPPKPKALANAIADALHPDLR
jgi:hypothetical protein